MYTNRWTIDDWRTTHDVHATFAQHYTDNRKNDARGTDPTYTHPHANLHTLTLPLSLTH